MGLQTALFQSLSGLNANSQTISVSGNNISNVNTTGFKASRASFETQISQSLGSGSQPTATLGGSNPSQVGLGVRLSEISRNFNDGSLQPTGVNTDLAIEGAGMFVLDFNGSQRYTRAGTFSLDRDKNLVNPDGGFVQGFAVDSQFNVVQGLQTNVNIPIGTLTLAEATQNVQFSGNLNTDGQIATQGSINTSAVLFSAPAVPAVAGDLLTTLQDAGAASLFFAAGDVITITGVEKGGATLPDHTFEVGPANTTGSDDFGTTLQDYMDFLEEVLGIDTTISGGIAVVAGAIEITGNTGAANDITLETSDILVNGTTPPVPLVMAKTQNADGESVLTNFFAFDSLGSRMRMDLVMVMENKTNAGTEWQYYVQSEDDSDLDRVLGSGLVTFDTNGRLVTPSTPSFNIDRANTGAFTPQQITMSFINPGPSSGSVSALADGTSPSEISAENQDGSPLGTLEDFTIGSDGTISGVFSNGLLRSLGQVLLATFANSQGLVDEGGNLFNISSNSGNATIAAPGSGRAGRIVGGALELSNVDLSEQFINLITASTGFSANSRVLDVSNRLIQELLATAR